jgi:cell division septation protein DedD
MALAVALVGVFLLGVKAGRGAIPSASAQPAAVVAASPTATPGALPPSTPAPNELRYQETLQGRPDAQASAAVPPPTAPVATPEPITTPAPDPKPTPKPAAATAKPASATAVWFVQVDAFGSISNANTRVAELKKKNIPAAAVDTPGSGARYKVLVGPLERAAADAMVLRLRKEGYKPSSPIRR